ncbi:hypothetical protein A9Q81_02895 [Gammaproteobacteria bacterium 42_54_T18]|nr:hypothetical protein A9Q81_02895 [Gammaproteobacteria bacterium 42_54_T18]
MTSLKFILGVIAVSLFSLQAAASIQVPSNQTPSFIINKISTAKSNAVLYLDSNHGTCGGSIEVVIDWSADPEIKNLYSTALTAFAAGKKVGFGANDCSGSSTISIYRIDVAK